MRNRWQRSPPVPRPLAGYSANGATFTEPGSVPDYDVGEIEARLAAATRAWTDDLRDALVVDIPQEGEESWLPLFVVLEDGAELDDDLVKAIRKRVREDCSPRHVPSEVIAIDAVPRTLSGKALRATAVNRLGARLVGIGTTQAGRLAFTLAAAMGALCGVLIAPLTTVYYDSGFLIGLKGFVGAIIGGLGSYPIAAAGAVLVGLLESYSSFWASALKEVIVFTLIIPVLLWRSLTSKHVEEEEE